MGSTKKIRLFVQMGLFLSFLLGACNNTSPQKADSKSTNKTISSEAVTEKKYKITFIELGSVKCIPCREMQKVIASVQQKYRSQVQTIFYDVWTKEGKPYADIYKINLILVQVFLDENGKEFYRHEGYFPEEELVAVLKSKGVTD